MIIQHTEGKRMNETDRKRIFVKKIKIFYLISRQDVRDLEKLEIYSHKEVHHWCMIFSYLPDKGINDEVSVGNKWTVMGKTRNDYKQIKIN